MLGSYAMASFSWHVVFCTLLFATCTAYEVTNAVEGTLGADEAIYYSVETNTVLIVALIAEEGDADLYASRVNKEPNFESSEFSSSSCGLDLLVIPTKKSAHQLQHIHLTVVGHSTYMETRYRMYFITPAEEDIRKYQVWDWDLETRQEALLMDYNPLELASDNLLHQLLDQLSLDRDSDSHVTSSLVRLAEWAGYLLLKAIEILDIFL